MQRLLAEMAAWLFLIGMIARGVCNLVIGYAAYKNGGQFGTPEWSDVAMFGILMFSFWPIKINLVRTKNRSRPV